MVVITRGLGIAPPLCENFIGIATVCLNIPIGYNNHRLLIVASEWVNSVKYDYPAPTGDGIIFLEARPLLVFWHNGTCGTRERAAFCRAAQHETGARCEIHLARRTKTIVACRAAQHETGA